MSSGVELTFIIELSAVVVIAAMLAYLFSKFKQPVLISYILTGFILGPAVLAVISSYTEIASLSELGVAFLLYAIGAELNLNKLKQIRKGIIVTTIIQVAACFTAGFFGALYLLGMTPIQSLFVGAIVSISSTAIVLKYMSDQKMGSSLKARIMLGVLLVQDFIIMLFLPLIMNLSSKAFEWISIVEVIGKILVILAIAMLINRFFFRSILKESFEKPDLLFMLSLASAFGFIWLSSLLDFSIIIGAFIGGLILTNYPYHLEIINQIKEIKSFFNMFFFVFLGMQIVSLTGLNIGVIILLLVISFVIKPIFLFLGTLFSGYDEKTSYYVASGLTQISEFSLVLVQFAVAAGIFTSSLSSTFIIVISLAMISTPYILNYNDFFEKITYRLFTKNLGKKLHKVFKVKVENVSNIENPTQPTQTPKLVTIPIFN